MLFFLQTQSIPDDAVMGDKFERKILPIQCPGCFNADMAVWMLFWQKIYMQFLEEKLHYNTQNSDVQKTSSLTKITLDVGHLNGWENLFLKKIYTSSNIQNFN